MNVSCAVGVQSVRQLQQQRIEVYLEMTGLPYQWASVANHSISSRQQVSLQLGSVGWFWRV